MNRRTAMWGLCLLVFVAGVCIAAATIWVYEDSAPVREKADRFATLVAEVERGMPLEVLGEDGDWVKVKLRDGRTGWVLKDSTTTSEPATGAARLSGGLDKAMRDSETDDTVRASGARGGLPYDSGRYAGMGGDFAGVQWMERQKDQLVGSGAMEKFLKEGNLR